MIRGYTLYPSFIDYSNDTVHLIAFRERRLDKEYYVTREEWIEDLRPGDASTLYCRVYLSCMAPSAWERTNVPIPDDATYIRHPE